MKLSPARRRALATTALVVAVAGTLVAASLVSRTFFEGPTRSTPPHHPPVTNPAPTLTLFRVTEIEGGVEAFHNNQWYVVRAGDLLPLQDVLRTTKASRVLLRRGGTEIEVREDVDVRLEQIAKDTASFGLLRGGKVFTTIDGADEKVAFTTAGTRVENEGPSLWVVELGANGAVTIGTAKGRVRFAAHGKEVKVSAGQESTALPDQEPEEPEPIPEDLLLSVIWPEIEHKAVEAQVTGKVRPSSRVKVNGHSAAVRADGRFVSSVPLFVGENAIEVQAEDLLGKKKSVSKVLKRVAPSPTLEPTDEELWKR